MDAQISVMSRIFLFLISTFLITSAVAQSKKIIGPPPQKAKTKNPENAVYSEANFDAPILTILPPGKIYSISNKLFSGAFYRIRVKPDLVGFIADSDVEVQSSSGKNPKKVTSQEKPRAEDGQRSQKKNSEESSKAKSITSEKRKPFEFSRYLGPSFSMIQFEENTMGSNRKENMSFFGIKLSGPDVLIEGLLPTEINVVYSPKAPGYYEELTKVGSSGWIFMTDFLLQTYLPQTSDSLLFFGFGPLFRYSKFDVGLKESANGPTTTYSAQDMTLGAAFNAGIAMRVSTVALRLEAKYHWEKRAYFGFGGALQFLF